MDWTSFQVKHCQVPEAIYYVPDFITEYEESELVKNVLQAPKPKWTFLSNRSLQNWGGLPHPKGTIHEPLPRWLSGYADKLGSLGIFQTKTPNHVLVNRYEPGQGIMAHEDGPLFYPTVATINTGSHTILRFYKKEEAGGDDYSRRCLFSLLLWPRSLLILKDDAYTGYLHEIEERESDSIDDSIANLDRIANVGRGETLQRETRFSFTIRLVTNLLRADLSGLLFNKRV